MTGDNKDLEGKVAVVTGASSGIGAAAARRFASEGMHVVLGARRGNRLRELAQEIEGSGTVALAEEVDVRDWDMVRGFRDVVEEEMGQVDLLFANAGTGGGAPVMEMGVETWERVIGTNLTGVFHTCKALLPLMTGHDGPPRTLAVTASVSGTMGMAGASAYCASKWGVRGFVQSLALEVSPEVRAFTVNPGYVNTSWHEGHPRAEEMVQPEDVAELVVDLATLPPTAHVDDVTLWPARMYSE